MKKSKLPTSLDYFKQRLTMFEAKVKAIDLNDLSLTNLSLYNRYNSEIVRLKKEISFLSKSEPSIRLRAQMFERTNQIFTINQPQN